MPQPHPTAPPVTGSGPACRICGSAALHEIAAREMMYGTRAPFIYLECEACGCVQISAYPTDIAQHYPPTYYCGVAARMAPPPGPVQALKHWVKAQLLRVPPLRRAWLRRPQTAAWIARHPLLRHYLDRLDNPEARILDVGCGEGQYLHYLRAIGYRHAEGIDPFIASDILDGGRRLVTRATLEDVARGAMAGRYDCVSLHHSLEHMPEQAVVLRQLRALLAPGGILIIRIPVAGSAAWRRYGTNWAQLDPPRHYYLHSERSFRLVAAQAGLAVREIAYDSDGFQFWASELYVRDIPLTDPRSPRMGSTAIFSAAELAAFDAEAAALNAARDGDQIVAVLVAAPG